MPLYHTEEDLFYSPVCWQFQEWILSNVFPASIWIIMWSLKFADMVNYTDFFYSGINMGASLMAQQVKNPTAMQDPQEMQVRSLGLGDSLE